MVNRFIRLAVAALAPIVVLPFLGPVAGAATFTDIDGGQMAAQWTATADGPEPFDSISPDLAVPITMDDGVVLKADMLHPANGPVRSQQPGPVVLQFSGYGKQLINVASALVKIPGIEDVLAPLLSSLKAPGSGLDGITDLTSQLDSGVLAIAGQNLDLVKAGYTVMQVDIRGTGTSEGRWQVFGDRERRDAVAVLDWVNAQPWSNGKIGVVGTSFSAITAMQAAATAGNKVTAAFTLVPTADLSNDIVVQGGAVGAPFLTGWLIAVAIAKVLPDVEAILAGRFDPAQQLQWLRDRLADPGTLLDVMASAYTSVDTDQFIDGTREIYDAESPRRQTLQYDAAAVTAPTFTIGASSDLFGSSPTDTYNRSPLPLEQKKLILGDGYHGLVARGTGMGHPGTPPRLDVLQRAWFDKWLKGIDNGIDQYSPLTLQQPDKRWVTSTSFPRAGVDYRRMYLTDSVSGTAPTALVDGGLAATPSQAVRDLTVAPSLLSICSRDAAITTAGVTGIVVACAEDSRVREAQGLTFTSSAVDAPTAVSGPINVHLNAVHDTVDGYWTVTVNDVAPDGWSRQISSGQLVSSLREIDDAHSTRSASGDYTRAVPYVDSDRRNLVVPGQPVTLDVASSAVDATLQPGHRLRVDVFASNFPKGVPPTPILFDSKLAPQHLRLDPNAPSWVNVPLSQSIPN